MPQLDFDYETVSGMYVSQLTGYKVNCTYVLVDGNAVGIIYVDSDFYVHGSLFRLTDYDLPKEQRQINVNVKLACTLATESGREWMIQTVLREYARLIGMVG